MAGISRLSSIPSASHLVIEYEKPAAIGESIEWLRSERSRGVPVAGGQDRILLAGPDCSGDMDHDSSCENEGGSDAGRDFPILRMC
jgi:hypothetical protein